MRIDVKHVADLARLRFSPGEMTAMEKDLEFIFEHIDRLSQIDVEGVPPTFGSRAAKGVRLDQDSARPGLNRERVLEIAPSASDGYYVMPKEASLPQNPEDLEPGGRR